MRKTVHDKLKAGRITQGRWASDPTYGLTGAFDIFGPKGGRLHIISSGPDTGTGWEHVSVSIMHRIPNWEEMCYVKDLFWDDEDCVVQFHPPKSQYVNYHPTCLHLWKSVGMLEIVPPPKWMVGPTTGEQLVREDAPDGGETHGNISGQRKGAAMSGQPGLPGRHDD
jgi:hypothetical protein